MDAGQEIATIVVFPDRLESIIVIFYSTLEFFHAIAITLMQVLLLYSNYAHFIYT